MKTKPESIEKSISKNPALKYGWNLLKCYARYLSGNKVSASSSTENNVKSFCSLCKELSEIYSSANATEGEARQFAFVSNTLLCSMVSRLKAEGKIDSQIFKSVREARENGLLIFPGSESFFGQNGIYVSKINSTMSLC
ncbi:MAG: hypothetical protein WC492_04505 [Candidatus Micrarchaeia archaeon]